MNVLSHRCLAHLRSLSGFGVLSSGSILFYERHTFNTNTGQWGWQNTLGVPIDVVTPNVRIRKCRPSDKFRTVPYLKLGTSLSPIVSVGRLRGFAYCPAMRPIRTTGIRAPQIRIKEKERINPIFAVMFSCGCRSCEGAYKTRSRGIRACKRRNFLRNRQRGGGTLCSLGLGRVGISNVRSANVASA